jgi:hypothetical protein
MRFRIVHRGGVIVLLAVAALLAGVTPASAAPGDGSAYAIKVNVTLSGAPVVNVGPLASANTAGPTSGSLASASVPNILTAGVLNAAANKDPNTGEVTASASTADLSLPLLQAIGPVSAKLIEAKCTATQSGETGSTTLTAATLGSLGALAANPAANTKISIGLPAPIGNIATLTLNEQINNPDGSLTVNAFHLHLLGGPGVGQLGSGDVIISSATCGPAGLPMPIASGLGLWIGLGLLGAVAVPIAIATVRRRRTAAAA